MDMRSLHFGQHAKLSKFTLKRYIFAYFTKKNGFRIYFFPKAPQTVLIDKGCVYILSLNIPPPMLSSQSRCTYTLDLISDLKCYAFIS